MELLAKVSRRVTTFRESLHDVSLRFATCRESFRTCHDAVFVIIDLVVGFGY